MPELVRLLAVASSLMAMWVVSAGVFIHGFAWGWFGLELAWSLIYPDLKSFLSDMQLPSHWVPVVMEVAAPSWRSTIQLTLWVAASMSAIPVLVYSVVPLRFQVRGVLGPRPWALTEVQRRNDTLREVFEGVKRKAKIRKPVSLYLVKIGAPVAFAMGAPFRGAVVISAGLVNELSRDELEWVMAHELAHIRYRDMMLGALWISSMRGLYLFDRLKVLGLNVLLRGLFFLRAPVRLVALLLRMLLAVLGVGRWFALKLFVLVDRWVSRRTEFRADFYAAALVGGDAGARALSRLGGDAEPLFNGLFATHPKTSTRIKRLLQHDG